MIRELWMLIICLKKNMYDIDSGVDFFFTIKFYFWHFECRGLTFIELN